VTKPFVEILAATSPVPDDVVELVAALRAWCRPHVSDPGLGPPRARLALLPRAAGLLDAVSDRSTPLGLVTTAYERVEPALAARLDVVVVRGRRRPAGIDADRVVHLATGTVDTSRHPPVAPALRREWRALLGLPDDLVVTADHPADHRMGDAHLPSLLAVAAAAVVRGPSLSTALALGTPVVTDPVEARRIGAIDGEHVVVAAPTDAHRVAEALGRDLPRAAALGRRARRLAETRLDLRSTARAVAQRLGLISSNQGPYAGFEAALRSLHTPLGDPVTWRATGRLAPLDVSALTARAVVP